MFYSTIIPLQYICDGVELPPKQAIGDSVCLPLTARYLDKHYVLCKQCGTCSTYEPGSYWSCPNCQMGQFLSIYSVPGAIINRYKKEYVNGIPQLSVRQGTLTVDSIGAQFDAKTVGTFYRYSDGRLVVNATNYNRNRAGIYDKDDSFITEIVPYLYPFISNDEDSEALTIMAKRWIYNSIRDGKNISGYSNKQEFLRFVNPNIPRALLNLVLKNTNLTEQACDCADEGEYDEINKISSQALWSTLVYLVSHEVLSFGTIPRIVNSQCLGHEEEYAVFLMKYAVKYGDESHERFASLKCGTITAPLLNIDEMFEKGLFARKKMLPVKELIQQEGAMNLTAMRAIAACAPVARKKKEVE